MRRLFRSHVATLLSTISNDVAAPPRIRAGHSSASVRRRLGLIAITACAAAMVGCQTTPSNSTTNAGGDSAGHASSERIQKLEADLADASHSNEMLRSENHALRVRAERATAARDEITKLLEQRASAPLSRPEVNVSPLSPEFDAALADFARRSGGQASYDRDHAGLLFAGDALYETASDELRSEFRRLLGDVAAIASRHGDSTELFVVGYTDDAPIQQPETLVKHPTSWHLAAHRAIAARDALVAAGISETRIAIAAQSRGAAIGGQVRLVSVFFVRKGEFSARGGSD